MNRVLSLVLCLGLVLTLLPAMPLVTAQAIGSTTINGQTYFTIRSASDLVEFASMVKSGQSNINAILMSSISMSGVVWEPIGTKAIPYTGNFDGNGNGIYNLNINKANTSTVNGSTYAYAGLFGCIKGGVQNLNVSGHLNLGYSDTNTYATCGLLVGEMQDSILYNCRTSGSVNYYNDNSSTGINSMVTLPVGGMLGHGMHSILINCGNEANVSTFGTMNVAGGLVGYLTAGYDLALCVLNSYNTGNVTSDADYVGGLAGHLADDAVNNYNYGTVSDSQGNSAPSLFGFVTNSIMKAESDTSYSTFTPVIKNNYYLSGTTAIGSTVADLDTTGYTTAFNSGDVTGSLRDTLNGNLATVEEIIAGHLGYLQSSQWANLIAELNGQNVRAMKWHIENGHPVPSNCSFTGGVCSCGAVQYIEHSWNGSSVVSTTKSADATAVNSTGFGVTWSSGWYKVTGNVTIDDRATVSGTVNLILCDGAKLTVNDGIVVNAGNTLNIYGQSAGTGKLVSTGYDYTAGIGGYKSAAGTITIHGGNITAAGCTAYNVSGNFSSAGIGGGGKNNGGGTVSVYGGTVTATGGDKAAGIGGNVIIAGGNVKAVAGSGAEAIGKGKGGSSSGTLKGGSGDVTLYIFTLEGAANGTAVTHFTGVTGYGLRDVKTLDTNKLYFYLPSGSTPTSVTAGGKVYNFICLEGNNYYTAHSYANGVCTRCGINSDGIYYIYTADDLMKFAAYVNAGNKGTSGKLMADIDMSGKTWTPIASTGLYHSTTSYADKGYTGTFDGNYHVISNLTIQAVAGTGDASFGLFGTLSGTVKNLGIYNFKHTGAGMDSRVGSIAGQMLSGSLIENCYAAVGNINTKVNTTNGVAGGIAGCNYAGTIRNCHQYNYTISAGRHAGIVGDNCGLCHH